MANGPKVGVFEFLENHLDYRFKLILPVFLLIAVVLGWNYIRDLQKQHAEEQQKLSTLEQKFQTLNGAAIAGNTIDSQKGLNQQGQQILSPEVQAFMKQQNAVLASLTQAVGTISARVTGLEGKLPTDFGGKQDSGTGTLTGFPIEEGRTGADGKALPPVSAINLFYDPKQKDPNLAFKGTSWSHYQEEFHPVIGQWEKKKDGGYKTSLSLSRTVSKPDPLDPTKLVVVGKEDIPITDASTIYGPEGMKLDPFKIPRWTAMVGFSKDSLGSNGAQPAATLDYRFTNKFGLTVGVVNKAAVTGLSIRF